MDTREQLHEKILDYLATRGAGSAYIASRSTGATGRKVGDGCLSA